MDTSVRCRDVQMTYEVEIPKEIQPLTTRDQAKALIALQSFEGSFVLSTTLAALLQVPFVNLEAKIKGFCGSGLSDGLMKDVWATVLAVMMFERKLAAEKDVWELVVEKAKLWVAELDGLKGEDLKKLEMLAGEVRGH